MQFYEVQMQTVSYHANKIIVHTYLNDIYEHIH